MYGKCDFAKHSAPHGIVWQKWVIAKNSYKDNWLNSQPFLFLYQCTMILKTFDSITNFVITNLHNLNEVAQRTNYVEQKRLIFFETIIPLLTTLKLSFKHSLKSSFSSIISPKWFWINISVSKKKWDFLKKITFWACFFGSGLKCIFHCLKNFQIFPMSFFSIFSVSKILSNPTVHLHE